MNIAYDAMVFARDVHRDQLRKYTGDIRTTDHGLIDAMRTLYSCGLRVEWIAKCCGIPSMTIRNFVANKGLVRDQSRFHEAPPCLAETGETFKQAHWATWYYVSDFGRIIGMSPTQPGRVVRATRLPNGYMQSKLVENDGIARNNYLHRAVLRVFRGEPAPLMEAAHGDGNKANNRLSNLRWATRAENNADIDLHGTRPIGSAHSNATIDESIAREIKRRLCRDGVQAEIARSLGVSVACVANIAQNKTWRHV